MAKNDDLDRMARELISKASKKKPADNMSAQPKKVATKAAPIAEPTAKAAKAPKAKPAPAAAKSKTLPKTDPATFMEPDVSIPKAKAKAAKSGSGMPHDIGAEADRLKAKYPSTPEMAARHSDLLDEFGAGGSKVNTVADALESDIPKGGRGAIRMAEELAPTATSRAEMSAIKRGEGKLMGRLGKLAGGSLVGATLAGPVGFGLQALMEGLDAEETGNPHEGHISNMQDKAAAQLADQAVNRQAKAAMASGRLKPPARHEELYGDAGPSPQQKMEDDYAEEMKKYPR